MATLSIAELMKSSGVKFGTSGARGRVEDMNDLVCYAYTAAFLQYLSKHQALARGSSIALAGDRRPSSPRIMAACALAISDLGYRPINAGLIPSPAVAYYGFQQGIPSLMVTGSHIPDDRNGIKFNSASGEILKRDEEAIRAQSVHIPEGRFDRAGAVIDTVPLPPEQPDALDLYVTRYTGFFPPDFLAGKRIALYEHSTVASEAFARILTALGADLLRLGYSDLFVPVDTEAIRPEDVALAADWAQTHRFDAIVSADGDGDRPLIGDQKGNWIRGDVAGVLCAKFLGADTVVTPISSNSVAEKSGFFRTVYRTRIGSPFVIEEMNAAHRAGNRVVAGYEANGGFLLASPVQSQGKMLSALPTRDAVIVALGIFGLATTQSYTLSDLVRTLPPRYTASDRVKEFPTVLSARIITKLQEGDHEDVLQRLEEFFGGLSGAPEQIDTTDGLRITFKNAEVVHLRPSGNAPEFRCYNEAASPERAVEMNRFCIALLETWKTQFVT